MSNEQNTGDNGQAEELELLKAEATRIGVQFHPSIGAEKLQQKIAEHLEKLAGENPPPGDVDDAPTETVAAPVVETESQKRLRIKREATKLVRVRITCMNPDKREWEGEIFTAANRVVTEKKMVPFNVPYHVPQIILNMIQSRKCQVFHTVTENGRKVRRGKLIKEFGVEILPPLTERELQQLAQRQAMAKGTADV